MVEEVISAEKTSDAFIAGGYSIKYKRDMFQHAEQFEAFCSNQDANFYVNIDKIYASTPDELKAMVNAKYTNRLLLQIDENEIKRNVFITFKMAYRFAL